VTESKLNLRTDDLWMYRLETDIITPEDALRAVYDASLNDPHLDQAQRSAVLHAVYDVERKLRDEQRRTLRRAALDQFGMAAMLCRERKRYGRPPGHRTEEEHEFAVMSYLEEASRLREMAREGAKP
jgi:hypothetical protein